MKGNIAFSGDLGAGTQFFKTCANIGARRERDHRECWTLDEWRAWVKRGRAAFGPSDGALYGQLRLVEIMLDNDLTAVQIQAEMRSRVARDDAKYQAKLAAQERDQHAAQKRVYEMEVDKAVRAEMVKATAKARVADQADAMGIATPGRSKRRLVGIGPGA